MLKKLATISLATLLTLSLIGTGSLLWNKDPGITSAAEDEHSIDFSRFTTTWNAEDYIVKGEQIDFLKEDLNSFKVESPYNYDKDHGTELKKKDLQFVSSSYNPEEESKSVMFDFGKSFSFKGTLQNSQSPDGIVVMFHGDKEYGYIGNSKGSGLCSYDVQGSETYVRNALAIEFDTYDSHDAWEGSQGKTDQDDLRELIDKNRPAPSQPVPADEYTPPVYRPHIAISTVDGSGHDTPRVAMIMPTGEVQFEVSWTITDTSSGKGSYSISYSTSNRSLSMTYSGIDPKKIMGTDKAYMAIAGSINFRNGTHKDGTPYEPTKDWFIQLTDFSYATPTATEAALSARVAEDGKTPSGLIPYGFALKDEEGKTLQTKQNSGQTIGFDKIQYTREGTYNYTIIQNPGSEPGVKYDSSVYDVEVKVVREHDALKVDRITYRKSGKEAEALFNNTREKADLEVTEKSTRTSTYAKAGKKYTHTVTIKNNGKGTAYGVFVRRYMPKYTHAVSVSKPGVYGYVNDKEHASAFFEKIPPGQSVTLKFKLRVDECKPDKLKLKKNVKYQMLDSATAPKLNGAKDPTHEIN